MTQNAQFTLDASIKSARTHALPIPALQERDARFWTTKQFACVTRNVSPVCPFALRTEAVLQTKLASTTSVLILVMAKAAPITLHAL